MQKRRGKIVLAVGLPGSGKSTYFSDRKIQPLSSDAIRLWLLDDESDQSQQRWIFVALRFLLKLRLMLGRPANYVDATNLTPAERRPYLRMAQRYGYEVHALYFDVPLETCLARILARHRTVPEDAMRRMAAKLTLPTTEEGFSSIKIVAERSSPLRER